MDEVENFHSISYAELEAMKTFARGDKELEQALGILK